MEDIKITKLERVQKHVEAIKGFYNHVTVYIIINIVLFILKEKFVVTLLSKKAIGDPQILNWIDWNLYGTPVIWGIGLVIHWLVVFKFSNGFLKKWEERKIKKYMQEDNF